MPWWKLQAQQQTHLLHGHTKTTKGILALKIKTHIVQLCFLMKRAGLSGTGEAVQKNSSTEQENKARCI